SNFGVPPTASRTTSLPLMIAVAVSLMLVPLGTVAAASANSATDVLNSFASMVADGAEKPGGKPSSFTRIGPSKPSIRAALILTGTAPPFHTAGAVGAKLIEKSGRGDRTVSRYA